MFDVVESGIAFYQNFTGQPFPYRQYCQVFVPEHNSFAMQNIGCVTSGVIEGNEAEYVHTNSPPSSPITFNESYIWELKEATLTKRLKFSLCNLHELCHCWFGNMITFKWWDDLGIDEGICTFLAHLAMVSSPRLSHFNEAAWITFLEYKYWGIGREGFSSCHSVCCQVQKTDMSEILYDGTAYGKCTGFMKQVYKVMGHEAMSAGFKLYFERNAYKNSTVDDVVSCLSEAFNSQSPAIDMGPDFNMASWLRSWLQETSGNVTLEPVLEFDQDTGKLTGLKIRQGLAMRGQNLIKV